jgi:hypothetical protein
MTVGRSGFRLLRLAAVEHSSVRNLLLAALAGGLLVLAFPKADVDLVAFIALVPLLI